MSLTQERMWTNPNEIPDNGIDDDGNLDHRDHGIGGLETKIKGVLRCITVWAVWGTNRYIKYVGSILSLYIIYIYTHQKWPVMEVVIPAPSYK